MEIGEGERERGGWMILPFYFTYAMRLQQRRSRSLSDPIGFVVSVSISAAAAAAAVVTPIATVEQIQFSAQSERAYLAMVRSRGVSDGLGETLFYSTQLKAED